MRLWCLVAVIAVLAIVQDGALARRGGGGGFRGGGIRGSRGGSSRYSGGSRYSGSGYTSAFAAGYIVGGLSRYRLRYRGTRYYREDPPVCYTTDRNVVDFTSSTKLGAYFVCPFKDSDTPQHVYCCGPATSQHCCTYWEDGGRMAGAIIGFILAGVLVIGSVILIVYCCCCKNKKMNKPQHEGHTMQWSANQPPPSY